MLALAALGIAWFVWLAGPDAHRWVAHRALEAALDRDVQVDGTLSVDVGAEPVLRMTGLRIDNPEWAESPTLLKIESAEIQIALRPLLRGVYVFPHIALDGVSVDLETAEDGRTNLAADGQPDAPRERPDSVSLPVFESILVSNATVIRRDLGNGDLTEVFIATLTNELDAETGGTRLDAHGTIDGRAFRISGASGSLELALAGTEPYPLELSLQFATVDVQIDGTIDNPASGEGLDLGVQVRSRSLRDALGVWDLSAPVDADVTAEARLTGDLADLVLTDLRAELAGPDGERFTLSGGFDDIWAGEGFDGRLALEFGGTSELVRSLPDGWQVIETLTAEAALSGGIAAPVFEDLTVEVLGPADSRLGLTGNVRLSTDPATTLESFELSAALAIPDPAQVSDRIGVDLPESGPLHGDADVTLSDQRIEVSRLSIEAADLGALSLEGSGSIDISATDDGIQLAQDFAFDARVAESGPLLRLIDPDLPELGPLQLAGHLLSDGGAYRLDDLELQFGAAEMLTGTVRGSVGPLEVDEAAGAELALTANLSWPSTEVLSAFVGQELPELGPGEGQFSLAGTVADLRIDDASFSTGQDGGVILSALGGIAHIRTSEPATVEGVAFDLELQAPSTAHLARLFDGDAPEIGPVTGRATLADRQESFALSAIQLRAGPAGAPIVELSGSIGDVIAFHGLDLQGSLQMPTRDAMALAGVEALADLGQLQGSIRLADIDGQPSIEQFEAKVVGTPLLIMVIDGSIEDLENIDFVEVETSLEIPHVADLAAAFGADVSSLEDLRYEGRLSGDGEQFRSDGRVLLGETQITGTFAADFTGVRPSFTGSLQSPHVHLDDFGPPPGPDDEPDPEPTAIPPYEEWLFDTDPFALDGLRELDLDLEIRIDQVEGVVLALSAVTVRIILNDGKLELAPLQFSTVGGSARANASLDLGTPSPTWQLDVEGNDLRLGNLWRELEFEVPLSGELDLDLDVEATGNSPRELASSLDGEMGFALQRGQIQTSLFYLTTTNPFRWLGASAASGGHADINCLVARMQLDDGVATTDALVLDTPNAIAAGEGNIDFDDETIDLRIRPSAKRRRIANLTTPFAIAGDLARPAVQFSTGGAAVRMVGEIAFSPINLLGGLLPFVGDRGDDPDNPCLTISDVADEE